MKKIFAVILLLSVTAGISSAEDFTVWNLNDRIHYQLRENFLKAPEMNISAQGLDAIRQSFTPNPKSLPKNERVNVHNEPLTSGLRVRVYTPKIEKAEYPALLWIHGGGHVVGSPEQDEALSLRIADELGIIVVAPDYRLTPENPYPADAEDCYEALKWLAENPKVRKDRIAVAGQSAGGGLTAAVALMARDKKGPAIHFHMPLYPMLDYSNITPSSHQINDHRVLVQGLQHLCVGRVPCERQR